MEHCHGVLDGRFGGYPLNGLHHYPLGLLVGRHLGIVHYIVDIRSGGGLGLVLEALYQFLLGLGRRQSRNVLQQRLCLGMHLVDLALAHGHGGLLVLDSGACALYLVAGTLVLALLLVELDFALLELCFAALELALALRRLLFAVGGDAQCLLAAFEYLVLFEVFGFFLSFGDDERRTRGGRTSLHHECHHGRNDGGNYGCGKCNNQCNHPMFGVLDSLK